MFKKIMAVVMLVLMIPLSVAGAGLGKIKIKSALGEPLDADIELVENASDEVAKLSAKVGGADDYAAAGLSDAYVPQGIHVQVTRGADNARVLHLSSDRPINEPFVELLIKAESPNSNFLRQYTLLLDPPISRMGDEADAAPGNASQQPARKSAYPKTKVAAVATESADGMVYEAVPEYVPAKSRKASRHHANKSATDSGNTIAQQPATTQQPGPALDLTPNDQPATDNYTTQAGDVFGKVAQRYQPQGVSLKRVMAAFFAANSAAFVNGDMNQLKAGQTLRIPSQQDMSRGTSGTAQPAPKPEAIKAPEKLTAMPAQDQETAPKPHAAAKFVLKISPGDADPVPSEQVQNNGADATASSNPAAPNAAMASRQDDAAQPASTLPAIPPPVQAAPLPTPQSNPAPLNGGAGSQQTPSFLDGLMSNLGWIVLGMAIPLIIILILYLLHKRRIAAMQTLQQNEFEDEEQDNDFFIAESFVATAPAFQAMAQKTHQELQANGSNMQAATSVNAAISTLPSRHVDEMVESAAAAMPEIARVHANQPFFDEVLASSKLADNPPSAGKPDESDIHEVDPLVEAEIYMSYGRSEQAETILQNALIKTPDKQELALGLLKIYAERADVQAFERVALTVQASAQFGKNEDSLIWDKAKTLGLRLDPNNALYQDEGHAHDAVPETAEPEQPEANVFDTLLELPPLEALQVGEDNTSTEKSSIEKLGIEKASEGKSNILEFTLDDISRPSAGKESSASLDAEELFPAPSKQK